MVCVDPEYSIRVKRKKSVHTFSQLIIELRMKDLNQNQPSNLNTFKQVLSSPIYAAIE